MPSLRTFLDDALQLRGPSTVEELAVLACAGGVTRAQNPAVAVRAALGQAETAIPLPDGRWTCAAWLLDGAVLTHRVRSPTDGRRDLWPRNDVFPLDPLLPRGLPLVDGGNVTVADSHRSRTLVLLGPPGWLPAVPAGTLLALRWHAGSLSVAPTEVDPSAVADQIAMLREAFGYHREMTPVRRWQSPPAAAVLGALLETPGLLTAALPPLGEILGDLLRQPELPRFARYHCCCERRFDPADLAEGDMPAPDYAVDDDTVRPLFP
jgi:hypothetical protein